VNDTLKGKEAHLPDGHSFVDKDGTERHECRIEWWSRPEDRFKLKDVMMGCPAAIGDRDFPADVTYHSYTDTKPVFFGHYWLSGEPSIVNPSAVCLDYSVAKGGLLVACRLGDKNETVTKTFVTQRVV
jgi:hypothetical protein